MIYLSREEFDAAINKVMSRLDDLEKKIDATNFNISLLLSKSKPESEVKIETTKIDLKNIRPGQIIQTKEKIKKVK